MLKIRICGYLFHSMPFVNLFCVFVNSMFNTLKYTKFWFTVSGIMLFGIVSLSVYGLKLGMILKAGPLWN